MGRQTAAGCQTPAAPARAEASGLRGECRACDSALWRCNADQYALASGAREADHTRGYRRRMQRIVPTSHRS